MSDDADPVQVIRAGLEEAQDVLRKETDALDRLKGLLSGVRMQELYDQIEGMSSRVKQLETSANEATARADGLDGELGQERERFQKLSNVVIQQEREIEKLRGHVANLQGRAETLAQYEDEANRLRGKEQELQDVTARLADIETEHQDTNRALQSLRQEQASSQARLASLEKEHEQVQGALDVFERWVATYGDQLRSASAALPEVTASVRR